MNQVVYTFSHLKYTPPDPLTHKAIGLSQSFYNELASALLKSCGTLLFFRIDQLDSLSTNLERSTQEKMVLRVLDAIRSRIRSSDVSCRYYHDNIVVILNNTGIDNAHLVAERLRETIARLVFWVEKKRYTLTVSVGYTAIRKEDSQDAVLARADVWLSEKQRSPSMPGCIPGNQITNLSIHPALPSHDDTSFQRLMAL